MFTVFAQTRSRKVKQQLALVNKTATKKFSAQLKKSPLQIQSAETSHMNRQEEVKELELLCCSTELAFRILQIISSKVYGGSNWHFNRERRATFQNLATSDNDRQEWQRKKEKVGKTFQEKGIGRPAAHFGANKSIMPRCLTKKD